MIDWRVMEDSQAVAQAASKFILETAQRTIVQSGKFRIVLAGGHTPELTYRLLQAVPSDWSCWHIYYGDERCSEVGRNSAMASQAWLNEVAIPATQIHPIPAHLGPHEGARRYDELLRGEGILPFDLVLLGMGEDGHTASLFPGHIHAQMELVHPVVNAPKPPPERISLSVQVLSRTHHLLFLITGANKHEAIVRWREGEKLPIAKISSLGSAVGLIDKAAWGG